MKWRIKHPNPKKIKNILVVKNDRIGDIILSSCTFRELKRAYPKSKITLIASKENESIIKKNKFIDFVYISDHSPRNYEEFKRYFSIIRRLRKTKFDLGVELRGGFYNILMMYLAGAKYRIGFYSQLPGKYLLHYGRTKKKYKNKKIHHSKMRIEVLNTGLGIGSTNNWPDIATDKNDEKIMRTLMKKHGLKSNQFISIIPDASMDKKAWPLNRYNELIKRLHKKYPKKKIVLLGTDKEKIEWLANKNKHSVVLIREPLRAVHLLLSKSSLTIAHDGAGLHLAWTTHAPTLGLIAKYLPIDYIEPLGKNGHYMYRDLKTLNTQEVYKKAEEIIKQK